MKEQIEKVLAMAKAGTISDAQAVELIEALNVKVEHTQTDDQEDERHACPSHPFAGREPHGLRFGRPPQFGERFGLFERVIDAVSGGRSSNVRGVLPSQMNGNDFSMSEVDIIGGSDHVFRDNHVRMSHMKDLTLTRSQMVGNDIGTSKISDITCIDSELSGCTIHASSFEDIALVNAQLCKVNLRVSKLNDTKIQLSRFEDVTITASSVKNFGVLEGSAWERSRIDATQLNHVATTASTVSDVGFDMSRLTNVDVKRSVLRISMVRGYKWADVHVVDCTFEDVMFGLGDANRKCLVKGSRFESCRFEKAIFADTSIIDTTIRNVTLSGVKVMGVNLRNQTIDGNEQFIAAIGGEQALVKNAP